MYWCYFILLINKLDSFFGIYKSKRLNSDHLYVFHIEIKKTSPVHFDREKYISKKNFPSHTAEKQSETIEICILMHMNNNLIHLVLS